MKVSSSKLVLLNLLCFTVFPAAADNGTALYSQQQQMSASMQQLVTDFQNFGSYLGFNVTQAPNPQSYLISYNLINFPIVGAIQTYMFNTYLGSIPVNTFTSGSSNSSQTSSGSSGDPFAQLVPANSSNSVTSTITSTINGQVNSTFNGFNGSGTGGSTTTVTANPLLDQSLQPPQLPEQPSQASQQNFQQDPVSQTIINVLGTPDYTFCMDNSQTPTKVIDPCPYLYNTKVSQNVIGDIPNAYKFFAGTYISEFLNQLNSNALTGPLMYSNQSLGTGTGNGTGGNMGLTAQTQEQLALNFIRYVSGSVVPIKLPKRYDYDQLVSQFANVKAGATLTPAQMKAQQTLAKYLASLRTYAAQTSVGVSNLYFIMSKRLSQQPPQGTQSSGSGQNLTPQSQALTEFTMATWRLFPSSSTSGTGGTGTSTPAAVGTESGTSSSNSGPSSQWLQSLNTAAPATVEKEIAILLAEINYQLYLDRQIHERLLMTNSILLLQSVRTGAPNADLNAGQ
ncbi:Intracellular multiplication protein IcmX [Legionella steigerwaltii]|uniref:Intracellular multiplication protein IcmX n=1 Tax=Legionella steigerwaltii TaxID=460 RepID=A0A378LB69_9GAMM|nr:type IVB secretion system protein IcmX [Legionella steigerwaltii]KTD78634.1 Intracellular multiplication protein IcmX [Legionella steigerwaltii]STY24275.1 Intracellular multiplication protein IcmX [Legionella steigerwaltii]